MLDTNEAEFHAAYGCKKCMPDFEEQISDYRKALQVLEQKMQSEYDKAIMALSGGALGVSMTFLKDIVLDQGVSGGNFLLWAWVCWGISVTCTLFSFYTSAQALRRAVQQTDDRAIYLEMVGGKFNCVTKILNFCAGALFMLGVILIVLFASRNLP
ncbi:MAG: hypothetical protein WDM76_15905 [Limisphaerales bacterium]